MTTSRCFSPRWVTGLATPLGYRSGHPIGHPPRTPQNGLPGPGPGRAEISARAARPGPARPGPPGRPGSPPGALRDRPARSPFSGPNSIVFVVLGGGFGGYAPTPLGTPPGRPGAREGKKCTFFWVFNNSPSRDKNLGRFSGRDKNRHFPGTRYSPPFGPYLGVCLESMPMPFHHARHLFGYCHRVSAYVTHHAEHAMLGQVCQGDGLATGTHWTALRPMGGTWPSEDHSGAPARCGSIAQGLAGCGGVSRLR